MTTSQHLPYFALGLFLGWYIFSSSSRVKDPLGELTPPAVAPLEESLVVDNSTNLSGVADDVLPVSTPSYLANRSGLGGAPFTGSQARKIGGSRFLPYAAPSRPVVTNDPNDWRPPASKFAAPKPAAPKAPGKAVVKALPAKVAPTTTAKLKGYDPNADYLIDVKPSTPVVPR